MSVSKQFASIGLPQKKRPRTKKVGTTTTVVTTRPAVSTAAFKMSKQIQATSQKSLKSIDLPNAAYPLTLATATNANIVLINIVQEGVAEYQRASRNIEMASVHINGLIEPNATAQTGSDFVQWAIIYDRQPSNAAALPIYSTLFVDNGPTGTAASNSFASFNLDNKDRFVILRNKRICLPSSTAVAGTNPSQILSVNPMAICINEFVNLKGLVARYASTSNPITVTNVSTGALYLVTQGRYASGAQGWSLQASLRLKYKDI